VKVSRAPISVTLAGMDRLEGAVATNFMSAVCAEAARLRSEEGMEAVSASMREAILDSMSLTWEAICGAH
jgi:hypothetical protein